MIIDCNISSIKHNNSLHILWDTIQYSIVVLDTIDFIIFKLDTIRTFIKVLGKSDYIVFSDNHAGNSWALA